MRSGHVSPAFGLQINRDTDCRGTIEYLTAATVIAIFQIITGFCQLNPITQ
jgi:hypothetical protein